MVGWNSNPGLEKQINQEGLARPRDRMKEESRRDGAIGMA